MWKALIAPTLVLLVFRLALNRAEAIDIAKKGFQASKATLAKDLSTFPSRLKDSLLQSGIANLLRDLMRFPRLLMSNLMNSIVSLRALASPQGASRLFKDTIYEVITFPVTFQEHLKPHFKEFKQLFDAIEGVLMGVPPPPSIVKIPDLATFVDDEDISIDDHIDKPANVGFYIPSTTRLNV